MMMKTDKQTYAGNGYLRALLVFLLGLTILGWPAMGFAQQGRGNRPKTIHLQSEITLWNLRKSSNSTFVQLGQEYLSEFGSDYCRSLHLKKVTKKQISLIQNAIRKDREIARVVREIIDGGILVSGYYVFSSSPATPNTRFYVIYSRNLNDNSVYFIVLCGANDTDELAEMLRANSR